MRPHKHILPVIVLAQFCCTSLWFAGNAVTGNLVLNYNLEPTAMGHLTSAVQFGFIIGTLIYALLTIADRFSPSKVFFVSALVAAMFNAGTVFSFNTFSSLLGFRFFTGFFLAGIYPVGMKLAADYFDKGLGKSLGYLVGALVVGTAIPHLIKGYSGDLPWEIVSLVTSFLAILGGLLILFIVPDGPYRKQSHKPDLKVIFKIFRNMPFRSAALGYFGHMWELYAFWAFVPVILITYMNLHPEVELDISVFSFLIIGVGGLGCIIAGYLSKPIGTKKTAAVALTLSGLSCLVSPLFINYGSFTMFITFLVFWGIVVVADSPLFSTLVAQNTNPETKGTALTIVNSIGFFVTILSIQLLNLLQTHINPSFIYTILALGPFLGLLALYRSGEQQKDRV